MTNLSQIIFDRYQIRRTKAQKQAFLDLMCEHYPQAKIEEDKSARNRNLVIGDTEKAEVIVGAHYDTCARMFFPNFLTPKNIPIYILFNLTVTLVFAGIAIGLIVGIQSLIAHEILARVVSLSVYFAVVSLLLFASPNKHTANDNTSGVITLCEIMEELKEEERARIAFVFFDNEERGMRGSRFFRKKYGKILENKLMLNFDCVSDGDHFLLIQNKPAEAEFGQKLQETFPNEGNKQVYFDRSRGTIYPSDQRGFPKSIAFAAFHKGKRIGFYINRIHTPRDTVFDTDNINYFADHTSQFLRTLIS